MRHRFKKGSCNLPENPCLSIGLSRCKSQTNIPEMARGQRRLAFHELKHPLVHHCPRVVIVIARLRCHGQLRLQPAPLIGPQVGGVNPVSAYQRLNITVLRKQGNRRHWLARQHTFEVFSQRKARTLYFSGGILTALLGLLHKLLYRGLHRPKQ